MESDKAPDVTRLSYAVDQEIINITESVPRKIPNSCNQTFIADNSSTIMESNFQCLSKAYSCRTVAVIRFFYNLMKREIPARANTSFVSSISSSLPRLHRPKSCPNLINRHDTKPVSRKDWVTFEDDFNVVNERNYVNSSKFPTQTSEWYFTRITADSLSARITATANFLINYMDEQERKYYPPLKRDPLLINAPRPEDVDNSNGESEDHGEAQITDDSPAEEEKAKGEDNIRTSRQDWVTFDDNLDVTNTSKCMNDNIQKSEKETIQKAEWEYTRMVRLSPRTTALGTFLFNYMDERDRKLYPPLRQPPKLAIDLDPEVPDSTEVKIVEASPDKEDPNYRGQSVLQKEDDLPGENVKTEGNEASDSVRQDTPEEDVNSNGNVKKKGGLWRWVKKRTTAIGRAITGRQNRTSKSKGGK